MPAVALSLSPFPPLSCLSPSLSLSSLSCSLSHFTIKLTYKNCVNFPDVFMRFSHEGERWTDVAFTNKNNRLPCDLSTQISTNTHTHRRINTATRNLTHTHTSFMQQWTVIGLALPPPWSSIILHLPSSSHRVCGAALRPPLGNQLSVCVCVCVCAFVLCWNCSL